MRAGCGSSPGVMAKPQIEARSSRYSESIHRASIPVALMQAPVSLAVNLPCHVYSVICRAAILWKNYEARNYRRESPMSADMEPGISALQFLQSEKSPWTLFQPDAV